MKRRDFCKEIVILPASAALVSVPRLGDAATPAQAEQAATTSRGSGAHHLLSKQAYKGNVPPYVKYWRETDMDGIGPDGKPVPGYKSTRTGSPAAKTAHDPSKKPHEMKLTREEQAIMDGKKGEAAAKLMQTIVRHGNLFSATKLVDLGGNPHSSMFIGSAFMGPFLKIFSQCADEGLKSYAPYTINPRPFDLYNVQITPELANMMFEGLPLQTEVDHLHNRLGGRPMNTRSCMCYLPEVGNEPEKGTFVAWGESSAINAINSLYGVRTNRNAAGMEVMCALLGKAPYFGLMTDEGRKATWLIEVKTSGEPDWGTLGGAIGEKCVEDTPYIVGIDKYLDGKLTPENLHKVKAMGAATASSGAVGLYHVENITPEAKDKGRDLLAEGYQTYVIDDMELKRVRDAFPNLWPKKVKKPTAVHIGCPHNTYHELEIWGDAIHKALKDAGKDKVALQTVMFCSTVVRDHFFMENPELVRDLYAADVRFSNTCTVCFAGMKGYTDGNFAVTNSNKTRKYTNSRYIPEMDRMLHIIVTGEMPA